MYLLAILLTVLFTGLKLTGYITWSWLLVISPIIISMIIVLVIIAIMLGSGSSSRSTRNYIKKMKGKV